jgi:hypothetical protein
MSANFSKQWEQAMETNVKRHFGSDPCTMPIFDQREKIHFIVEVLFGYLVISQRIEFVVSV